MAFDGSEGTFITLADGSAMTERFRDEFLTGNRIHKAVFFGREKLLALLNQADNKGIRCYFAASEKNDSGNDWTEFELVLVGADANENDQLGTNDKILDHGTPCPYYCSTANALNS